MKLQAMRRQDVPLHAEVAAVLRYQILSGEVPPGAKLPTLNSLVASLGVARMTVIQAMNTLEEEGLIERHSGRGTYVREVTLPKRSTLHMTADISQIYALVAQLQVDVKDQDIGPVEAKIDGRDFRVMRRTHLKNGNPFCFVELRLDATVFEKAPDRFLREIAVTVLEEINVQVASARQSVTISHARNLIREIQN